MFWEGLLDGRPDTPLYDPYLDMLGYWTIGYGHLIYHEGKPLKGKENRKLAESLYPNGLTKDECVQLLIEDVQKRLDILRRRLRGYHFTPHQLEALVSLSFNVGVDAVANSTLLRLHKMGVTRPEIKTEEEGHKLSEARKVPQNAPDQFLMWTMGRQNGKLVWIKGLMNRRWAERAHYLS